MNEAVLNEAKLAELREKIVPYLPNRMEHTLGVEREAVRLGELYLPEKIEKLRAAALLHDIAKRQTVEFQLQICRDYGILISNVTKVCPKPLHAVAGALLARRDFADYVDDEILSAIRWHTTGRRDMTLFEVIIYLADWIEDTRQFHVCREMRSFFWSGIRDGMTEEERLAHLGDTLLLSLDKTVVMLIEEGSTVDPATLECRNWLLEKKAGLLG